MATGADLRRAREAQGVTQVAIAAVLGVRRQTVIAWEQRAEVPRAVADRYVAALNALRNQE